jgi:hypothetical protein
MELALATFAWGPWVCYVLVTIAYEAWAFGRILRTPWSRSLRVSLGANALTALAGGCVSGVLAYAFLGIFGSRLNPNPLAQTLFLFCAFGLVSALIEAEVWRKFSGERGVQHRCLLGSSCLIHLIGVPLGLAILLLSPRPYPGLEGQATAERMVWLHDYQVRRALERYIATHQTLPPAQTYGQLLGGLRSDLGRFASDRGLWAAAYWPEYGRFDTGERGRGPRFEWNPDRRSAERLLAGEDDRPLWLTRIRRADWAEGLIMERGGHVQRTSDPALLGFVVARGEGAR